MAIKSATPRPPGEQTNKQYLAIPPYDTARIHGRVVKGMGHLGHNEAMEAGGREFDPRPGHYSRIRF